MKENLVIIDTTSLIWISCVTLDNEDNYALAKKHFNDWFQDILDVTEANYYIAFTDKGNFRRDLLPNHKADRNKVRPKFIKPLMEDAVKQWDIKSHSQLESDDLVLINHNYHKDEYNCIIAAPDSDYNQYPATRYNYKKKRKETNPEWQTIDEEAASLNLWTTILKGGHNGLKGLDRCGEETAKQYLKHFTLDQYPYAVLNAYINGINKIKYPGCRNVKGYGQYKGLLEYNKNFISDKLLTSIGEVNYVLPNRNINENLIINPIKIENETIEW